MSEFKLTCCSTCDLTKERLDELGIAFATYHYIIDGKDYPDDMFYSRTAESFYDEIDAGALPTTSQVTPEQLIAMIEPILKSGKDVLHVEFSSGLSGGWSSAQNVHARLTAKYPERKFYIVDSLSATSGYGLLMETAAKLKEEGMGIDELYNWIEKYKHRSRHFLLATDLNHLKRGGRVSAGAAVIGNILNVCPFIEVIADGSLLVRRKVMGKKKGLKEQLKMMIEQAEGGLDYCGKCIVTHSNCYDHARELADMVESAFPKLDGRVMIHNIGSVIGEHTGPRSVVLSYFSAEDRTM